MSTTASINPALANLLQTLSKVGSPLLSSPQAMTALQKASPGDIVQISDEATQLEAINAMLGGSDTATSGLSTSDPLLSSLYQPASSTGSTDPLVGLEQALASASANSTGGQSSTTGSTGGTQSSPSSASTQSLADAIGTYEKNLQAEEMQTLLGTDPSAGLATPSPYFG
jgi:hypothetical protein